MVFRVVGIGVSLVQGVCGEFGGCVRRWRCASVFRVVVWCVVPSHVCCTSVTRSLTHWLACMQAQTRPPVSKKTHTPSIHPSNAQRTTTHPQDRRRRAVRALLLQPPRHRRAPAPRRRRRRRRHRGPIAPVPLLHRCCCCCCRHACRGRLGCRSCRRRRLPTAPAPPAPSPPAAPRPLLPMAPAPSRSRRRHGRGGGRRRRKGGRPAPRPRTPPLPTAAAGRVPGRRRRVGGSKGTQVGDVKGVGPWARARPASGGDARGGGRGAGCGWLVGRGCMGVCGCDGQGERERVCVVVVRDASTVTWRVTPCYATKISQSVNHLAS